jgi:GT2 family glycosyltransferase
LLLEDGYGADRGYLQPDRGQFDEPVDVWAWCGATALLRVGYVRQVGCFWPPIFMYYDDADLAWRGRAVGWRYRYEPRSVVRHLHGTSAGEGSRLFEYQVERNRLVVLARNAPARLVWPALGRYLVAMAALARHDLVAAARAHRPPRFTLARRRLASLAGFLRLLPPVLVERRRLGRRQSVPDDDLVAWIQPRRSHPA